MLREFTKFKGLLPSIDSRRIPEPYVVEGRNFMVGVDGPYSAFASEELLERSATNPFLPQSFTTDAALSSWIFLPDGIYEPDISSGRIVPVLLFNGVDVTYFAPWTHALVGGKHFFANPFVGLVKYDPLDGSWVNLIGGSVPVGVHSVTDSGGRLVVLATGLIAWSAIDDGTNLVPSTSTGAGFQSISIVGSYTADSLLGVQRTPEGFLAFTKNGTLRARNTNNLVPYQVSRFSFAQTPLNAWCITLLEDKSILFLASTGLFVTDGNSVKPYNEILGSHLRDNIFPSLSFKDNGYICIKYLPSLNWTCILYSSSGALGVYNSAFVIDMQTGEVGKMSKLVVGVGEFQIAGGTFPGIRAGYIDLEGSLFLFSRTSSNISFTLVENFGYAYRFYLPQVDYGIRYEFGYRRFPVNNWMYTEDPTKFVSNNLSAGVYDEWAIQSVWPDSDYNALPVNVNGELDNPVVFAPQITHIDNFVDVGGTDLGVHSSVDGITWIDQTGGTLFPGVYLISPLGAVYVKSFITNARAVVPGLTSNDYDVEVVFQNFTSGPDFPTKSFSLRQGIFQPAYNIILTKFGVFLDSETGNTSAEGIYLVDVLALTSIKIRARIIGSTIDVWVDDNFAFTWTDPGNTYPTGDPAMTKYDVPSAALAAHPEYGANFNIFDTSLDGMMITSFQVSDVTARYEFSSQMFNSVILDLVGTELVPREQIPLDSSVTIGLLRLQDEAQINEMSLVTDVSIGMLDSSSTSDVVFTDWMADAGVSHFVDWMAGTVENFSDWGFESPATTDYTATLISSIDGATAIDGMNKVLTLPRQEGKQRIYDAYNTGLYHTVVISAENAGESIALKTLGVEMKQVGVL